MGSFTKISACFQNTCGLLSNGSASCWGVGGDGQLGIGSTANVAKSMYAVHSSQQFLQISCGGNFACGVLADQSAVCWGWYSPGHLGSGAGTAADANVPTAVGDGRFYSQISTSYDSVMALLS